ncbi:MAG: septation protein IspZ [Proteobacteria bacterium]|nr:septation protein IspZ [Pseudomonadota bacterium]
MQLLLELLPLAAFLVAYKFYGGIYVATATLMVGMTLSLVVLWLRSQKLPAMFAASTALVVVFGAATLFLRNARFIQWKPTIFLWLLAIAFLVSAFVGRQPLAQRMLQPALGEVTLQRRDWLKLNLAWVVFGLATGAANLLLAYNVSEADWVKLKVFGLTGVMILFIVGQTLWLYWRAGAQAPHHDGRTPARGALQQSLAPANLDIPR